MGYWEKRQLETYKAGEMQVNQYFSRLERAFNQTRRELQKTVESFYWRYAEENGLSYAAAQHKLNAKELGELKDFIDLSMKNIGKYNQTVNNLSIKARITRYQALEVEVDALLRQMYAVQYQDAAEKMMQEVYAESYYRTWYNIDQYRGFHATFAQIDPHAVETLLEYPFNGANFSSRLWKQKDHLQTQLMESLTTMMVQGKSPQALTDDFAKKMNSKKFDAYRLLHTESSFLMSEATHAGYKEDGVEKYQILATLDSKTCGICGDKDGDVYTVDKAVVEENMPPFHCFCRCTDVPYYDDMDLTDMSRVARDPETGKYMDVPADMTYPEWRKVMEDDGDFDRWRADKKRQTGKHQMIQQKVKEQKHTADTKILARDEEGAVIRYVGPEAYSLNDKLRRNAFSELTDFEKGWLESLDRALGKLPNYEGDLNRSLTFPFEEDARKFFDSLVVDKEYVPGQYLSTTKNGVYNEEGQVQIYIQGAKKGKDLGRLNDMENEVLYPIDIKFRVVNKAEQGDKFYVLLEEV